MTKAQLADLISRKSNVSKEDVVKVINHLVPAILETMASGEDIFIRGFGTFLNKKVKAKKARNISKNLSIDLPARFKPSFKPAETFKVSIENSPILKKRLTA